MSYFKCSSGLSRCILVGIYCILIGKYRFRSLSLSIYIYRIFVFIFLDGFFCIGNFKWYVYICNHQMIITPTETCSDVENKTVLMR
jgi:hypothetical protein